VRSSSKSSGPRALATPLVSMPATPTTECLVGNRGTVRDFLDDVTPMVITYNEEANIARTLARLAWARRILVIDSGSTDATLEIVRSFRQADIIHRPFDNFASQCNFGLDQIASPWVLSLDADYELSAEFVAEMGSLRPSDSTGGYGSHFVYRIHGYPLRGSLYPQRIVLYRKQGAFYRNEGHGHRVAVIGEVLPLASAIYHDDRKPLARWLASQQLYALREAEHLLSVNRSTLKRADRIRLALWPAPFLALVYALFVKGCVLDGWPGWFYALQRLLAETMTALAILNRRLKVGHEGGQSDGTQK
jgi:glycosyltransferase involved in cell wall biosynthesis